ncbi:MAG: ImmA/IrrE family metallo-endopeptidase [Methanosphaera stadtmanae]|nr:ImmA/IrrE family metallo-endopeptidase [Methanosphaera stadtmanae]
MGRVKINPEVLKWARIDAGYTFQTLPIKLQKNFVEWESGTKNPTWNQLCDISNQFKRPTAFFFRKNPPKSEEIDFIEYRKKTLATETRSPQLSIALRQYNYKRKNYIELLEDMNFPKIIFSKYTQNDGSTEELAKYIRQILEISVETQKSWIFTKDNRKDYNHYNFLNKWKEQINKLGVLVFEVPRVSLDEMRALCIYYKEYPIILLNGADSVNGRIFSLFHELCHLILGDKAICDIHHDNSKEYLCNTVAAEILVPKNYLLNEKIVKDKINNTWTDDELTRLSHIYGVSKETILLRLVNLHKTSSQFYLAKKEEWEKVNNIKQKKKGGGSPVKNQIKYNGKMYLDLFLTAYENNIITDVEFSEAVNLKLKHTEELANELI